MFEVYYEHYDNTFMVQYDNLQDFIQDTILKYGTKNIRDVYYRDGNRWITLKVES